MATNNSFNALLDNAMAQSFSGWDFSWVRGRITEADTSWSFRDLVRARFSDASALLDMSTGGGEFLASLGELPEVAYATEAYAPNVSVAKGRLQPLGVEVVGVISNAELPLPDESFNLVICRHGAYAPKELSRVAKPGACFLTQQVGGDNAAGLNEALKAPPPEYRSWCLDNAVDELESIGCQITRAKEERPAMSFSDIGAVVFYLNAVPWQVADFDVLQYRDRLRHIHNLIETTGRFEVTAHRFLIEATLL